MCSVKTLPQMDDRLHDDRDRCKAVPKPSETRRMTCRIQLFGTLIHRRFDLRYGGLCMFKHFINRVVLLLHYDTQAVVQHLSGFFSYALAVLLLQFQQAQLVLFHRLEFALRIPRVVCQHPAKPVHRCKQQCNLIFVLC